MFTFTRSHVTAALCLSGCLILSGCSGDPRDTGEEVNSVVAGTRAIPQSWIKVEEVVGAHEVQRRYLTADAQPEDQLVPLANKAGYGVTQERPVDDPSQGRLILSRHVPAGDFLSRRQESTTTLTIGAITPASQDPTLCQTTPASRTLCEQRGVEEVMIVPVTFERITKD